MTPKTFLKSFSTLYYCIFASILLMALYVFSQQSNAVLDLSPENDIFFYIVPTIAIAGFFGSNLIFKTYLNSLTIHNSLKSKLTGYQTASLLKYALIEGPAFLAMVIFMSERNLYYMIIAGILLGYFLMLRPSIDKISNGLNLSNKHRGMLYKEDEILS